MDRIENCGLLEPVAVRFTQSTMDDVQRVQARLAAEAPFARITQADAIRYLIRRGAGNEVVAGISAADAT